MLALESTIEVWPLELFLNIVGFVISFDKVIIVANEVRYEQEGKYPSQWPISETNIKLFSQQGQLLR